MDQVICIGCYRMACASIVDSDLTKRSVLCKYIVDISHRKTTRERDNGRRWIMHCGVVEESRVAVDPAIAGAFERSRPGEPRWCTVDRALRTIALRRGALDADEARWLREAEGLEIWHPLG